MNFGDIETNATWIAPPTALDPVDAKGVSLPRPFTAADIAALSSGRLTLVGVGLTQGAVISNIVFTTRNTAGASMTNQWFGLFDSNRVALAFTSDDTSTAWGANAKKSLALTSPYTITTSGLYYLGICVVGTTVPTLLGISNAGGNHIVEAPRLNGHCDTGLTGPPSLPFTAAAFTSFGSFPWAWCT